LTDQTVALNKVILLKLAELKTIWQGNVKIKMPSVSILEISRLRQVIEEYRISCLKMKRRIEKRDKLLYDHQQ
jgi:hypothetical protein